MWLSKVSVGEGVRIGLRGDQRPAGDHLLRAGTGPEQQRAQAGLGRAADQARDDGGFTQGGGHATSDQAELVVGDAGGAIDCQHQGQIDRVHGIILGVWRWEPGSPTP
jgi:hypothetical protein